MIKQVVNSFMILLYRLSIPDMVCHLLIDRSKNKILLIHIMDMFVVVVVAHYNQCPSFIKKKKKKRHSCLLQKVQWS